MNEEATVAAPPRAKPSVEAAKLAKRLHRQVGQAIGFWLTLALIVASATLGTDVDGARRVEFDDDGAAHVGAQPNLQ